tara:strand:- start:1970 stop:2281 length:312 start_codon:yes stop_codon:yes gene_type:complete
MRLTPVTGTATASGTILVSGARDFHVRMIEWHAGADNTSKIRIGDSGTTVSNGRPLVPGEQVTWDFSNMGVNNEPGHVLMSTLYVAISAGGDELNWTIFTTDD